MHLALAFALVATTATAAPDAELATAATRFAAREAMRSPRLSPDGNALLYIAANGSAGDAVMVTDLTVRATKPAFASNGKGLRPYRCEWAGNVEIICEFGGVGIALGRFASFQRLIAFKRDGTGARDLSPAASSRALAVSTGTGELVAILADRPGQVLLTDYAAEEDTRNTRLANAKGGLRVMRVDLATGTRAIAEPPHDEAASYMTDGHGRVRLMIQQRAMPLGYTGRAVRYLVRDAGGGGWRQIGQNDALGYGGFEPLAFDDDGVNLYVLDRQEGRQALFKLALDGSNRRELVFAHPKVDVDGVKTLGPYNRVVGVRWTEEGTREKLFDPALEGLQTGLRRAFPKASELGFFSQSANGNRLIVFAGSESDPGRYFLLDRTTKKLELLGDVRLELADVALGEQRAITYAAADGTRIPAILTLPPGRAPTRLPVVVMPHGGPAARDALGFDWLPQFFAARGYVVIQPNYRGSTGYGEGWFMKNGFKSWRTAISDVNDAARALVRDGIADPARLTIVGWSYGGYAALQANAVEPGLYKAAVAIAPVADLAQLRDEQRDDFTDYSLIRAYIGTGDHLREGSPARLAERIKAPVLLFHGDRDVNVDIAQSRTMKAALTRAGVRNELVVYPGLDHQLDDVTARTDMLTRSAAWLDAATGGGS